MGGKEIETDEQQQNDSHQSKMILKPLLEGIHGTPLVYFEVVGFTGKETCQIYRVQRFIGWLSQRLGGCGVSVRPAGHRKGTPQKKVDLA
jgi:hypothetical protein